MINLEQLAQAIGNATLERNPHGSAPDYPATIRIASDVTLFFRWNNWRKSDIGKVSISIHCEGATSGDNLPSIKVTESRPIAAIAQAIQSKLIAPSAETVATIRLRNAARRDTDAALASACAKYAATYPHWRIESPRKGEWSTRFYARGFHGRIASDGGLSGIERIGTIPADKAAQFVELMESIA